MDSSPMLTPTKRRDVVIARETPQTTSSLPFRSPAKAKATNVPQESLQWSLDGPMIDIETHYGYEGEPKSQQFSMHLRLLLYHSPYYKSMVNDFSETNLGEAPLVLHMHVKPAIFKRVRDYMYTGSFAPTPTDGTPPQKHKRPGRLPKYTMEYVESRARDLDEGVPTDRFEEQLALAEIWEFANRARMGELVRKVLRVLQRPVFRVPVEGCSRSCCKKVVV